ncbi:MAG: hypothetical protein HYS51_00900 [Candidatus Zambryskibacteria bacterium]|nr:hypothetical protein [Candidatus Zambryskibacteria bacterium]
MLGELDRALFTASHFGFLPIKAPRITPADLELVKHCGAYTYYDAAEKVALIRTYLEEEMSEMSHPLAIAYKKSSMRKKFGTYALHVVGSSSGMAEATLIRTSLSMLSEDGYKKLRVDLNCIGDKDSINAYERELSGFVKKFGAELPEETKKYLKNDIFNLFRLESEDAKALRENAPTSITFLSPQSRIYFKEVLEYIDALGIEFRITPELIGEKNHTTHTIFAIKDIEEEASPVLAVGYRYSRLARICGLHKETPLAGVTVFSRNLAGNIIKAIPKAKFCLLQLGQEAKIKTLHLLEVLRTHHISVHHFLSKDKFGTQLANAENLPVSYLIIIGQKEALDNTATIRNILTRAQDTVNLSDLPRYLKNIRL